MNKSPLSNEGIYMINITPMPVYGDKSGNAKGVLTLKVGISEYLRSKGLDLTKSIIGEFTYANRTSKITLTPKHKKSINPILQFTVNDTEQFKQLKIDGADSLVDGVLGVERTDRISPPSLECEINVVDSKDNVDKSIHIRVIKNIPSIDGEDRATKLMRQLIESNKSFTVNNDDKGEEICFENLSQWYDMEREQGHFREVTRCIYILWATDKNDSMHKKLYVGIVEDVKNKGSSKRNLSQRLREHTNEKKIL